MIIIISSSSSSNSNIMIIISVQTVLRDSTSGTTRVVCDTAKYVQNASGQYSIPSL